MDPDLEALLRHFESEEDFAAHLRSDVAATKAYESLPPEEREAVAVIYVKTGQPIREISEALKVLTSTEERFAFDSRMIVNTHSFYGAYRTTVAQEQAVKAKAEGIRKELQARGVTIPASVSLVTKTSSFPDLKKIIEGQARVSEESNIHCHLNYSN